MTNKQASGLAILVFALVVLVLAWPYLSSRLKPIEAIPATGATDETGAGESEQTFAPNVLKIPVLGIEAPVLFVTERTEAVYQEALKSGVVHFPGTALPGEPGNTYIFGHSSDYVWSAGEYKTVFARLPQIEIGTEIEITNAEGELFTYIVTETKIVGPRDVSVLDQFNNEKRILSLQTSYPLGTALQRFIVVAELKEILDDTQDEGQGDDR